MPICILRVPKTLSVSQELLSDICVAALDATLENLSIPKWDQEIRVERTNGTKAELVVSFTVGGEEYPEDFPNKVFDPEKGLLVATVQNISSLPALDSLRPCSVRLETWKESVFAEVEAVGGTIETNTVSLATELHFPVSCRISVALSPKYIAETQTGGSPEHEGKPAGQEFAFIKTELADLLGSEGDHTVELAISEPTLADTDISIDVDLGSKQDLTAEQLETVVMTIEQQLQQRGLAREGRSITIWAKQEGRERITTPHSYTPQSTQPTAYD
ncbi:MAG: hypothetical protein O2840_04095 [bacterium]|nr:hypothetical protein [bacterium]